MSAWTKILPKCHWEPAKLQERLDVHDWFPLSDEELQRELLEIFSAFLEPMEPGVHLLLYSHREKAKAILRALLRQILLDSNGNGVLDERLFRSAGLVLNETGLGAGPGAGPGAEDQVARRNRQLIELASYERPDWKEDMLEHLQEHIKMDMSLLDDLHIVVCEYEKHRSERWLGSACKYWSDRELQDRIEKSDIPIGHWLREATAVVFAFHGVFFIGVPRGSASEYWIWPREEDWTDRVISRMRILVNGLTPYILNQLSLEEVDREDFILLEKRHRKMEEILSMTRQQT